MSALDPDIEARIRDSFLRQTVMVTIGARLTLLEPGCAVIEMDDAADLHQQHGFLHGGVVGTIADSACAYAAMTLASVGADVVAVEYKINFLRPAVGERFVATGRVKRSGKRLSVVEGEVEAIEGDERRTVAVTLSTMTFVPTE